MISQSENKIEHLGTTIIFVLCFFLFAEFHQNSNNHDVTRTFQYQIETLQTFVVSSKDIPQLSFLQCFVLRSNELNFNHFNEKLKLLTDNRLIKQHIFTLNKVALLIKTVYQEFYYHQQSLSSEDNPILS
jgi:hypothetical protein